jgi:hypothetical protein
MAGVDTRSGQVSNEHFAAEFENDPEFWLRREANSSTSIQVEETT